MSLPSSMADFVPCDRLLQKAYSVATGYVHLTLSRTKRKFPSDLKCLKDTGLQSRAFSRDADERVNKTQPRFTSNQSKLLQKKYK